MKQSSPMVRKTPMKQSTKSMWRGTGFAKKVPEESVTPTKGARTRKCANRACRAPYMPDPKRPFINFCGPDCGTVIALEKLAKQKIAKAKSERAEDKRRKAEGMSHKDRLQATQDLINRVAVLRDWEDGCISCEKGPNWNGTWHGSHYKSVGSNSALRYNLFNISKSCSDCNWHRGGNIANMVPRLKMKFGADRVEWLDNHPRSKVHSTEYLLRLSEIARRWIRRREKKLGLRK